MKYQHKPDSGTLFAVAEADKRPPRQQVASDGSTYMLTDPDFSGSALIDGAEYFMDARKRQGQKGEYWAVKFKRKGMRPASKPAAKPVSEFTDDDLSQVPF